MTVRADDAPIEETESEILVETPDADTGPIWVTVFVFGYSSIPVELLLLLDWLELLDELAEELELELELNEELLPDEELAELELELDDWLEIELELEDD